MIHIDLTQEEHDFLVQVLEGFLSELRMEIADTDSTEFKDELKHEKHIVNDVLAKVKAAQP